MGRGRGAVAVARSQRARLPMAGDWREGLWLPEDGLSRWHKFAGLAGTCADRVPGGLLRGWAGGWRLAPGSGAGVGAPRGSACTGGWPRREGP